jgi:cytidine deaminase
MSEFVDDDFKIYVVDKDENVEGFTIKDLLPHSFKF